jgi:hypothetical protein
MAVERANRVITMSASADAITGKMYVQALKATGAIAGITDTDGNAIAAFGDEGTIEFPCKLAVDGLIRGAGAGILYVYLV